MAADEYDEDTLTNRFELYGALWAICTRWHSGQTSRGHRILSRLNRAGYTPGLGPQQGRLKSEARIRAYRHPHEKAPHRRGASLTCGVRRVKR